MTTTLEETISNAVETKQAIGHTEPVAVFKLWVDDSHWIWGWSCMKDVKAGMVVNLTYGNRLEIMAIV
jgi:hypothetical protein